MPLSGKSPCYNGAKRAPNAIGCVLAASPLTLRIELDRERLIPVRRAVRQDGYSALVVDVGIGFFQDLVGFLIDQVDHQKFVPPLLQDQTGKLVVGLLHGVGHAID